MGRLGPSRTNVLSGQATARCVQSAASGCLRQARKLASLSGRPSNCSRRPDLRLARDAGRSGPAKGLPPSRRGALSVGKARNNGGFRRSEATMRRLALALPVTLVMIWAMSLGALGDVSGTSVVLSCNDGHSVMLVADSATLTSLTADVQSINASGTGLVCTIDTPTLDPSAESADWTG